MLPDVVVATAGWSLPGAARGCFPDGGTLLERYAARLPGVEINSSFYRPHRPSTYARWAESVPDSFRFAVKLPKAITHDKRLVDCGDLLDRFAGEVAGLGSKRGPILVQLPPSLEFDAAIATRFFAELRGRLPGWLAVEPRHRGWFTAEPDALLRENGAARVAADPAPVPGAGEPGGWPGLVYLRLHGSPRIYYSDYATPRLEAVTARLLALGAAGTSAWCVFDNTALGHATGNALTVWDALAPAPSA